MLEAEYVNCSSMGLHTSYIFSVSPGSMTPVHEVHELHIYFVVLMKIRAFQSNLHKLRSIFFGLAMLGTTSGTDYKLCFHENHPSGCLWVHIVEVAQNAELKKLMHCQPGTKRPATLHQFLELSTRVAFGNKFRGSCPVAPCCNKF